MKEFTGTTGQKFRITINVASVRRVRDLLQVDLPNLLDKKAAGFISLINDPCQLVDVLWVLTGESGDGSALGEAMSGDALDAATTAFVGELCDFFPKAKAANLRELMTKFRETVQKAEKRDAQKIAELDTEKLAEDLEKKLKDLSGDAPE